MNKITEATTLSIAVVGMLFTVVVGAILWASTVAAKADMALEKASKVEQMAQDIAVMKNELCWLRKKKGCEE